MVPKADPKFCSVVVADVVAGVGSNGVSGGAWAAPGYAAGDEAGGAAGREFCAHAAPWNSNEATKSIKPSRSVPPPNRNQSSRTLSRSTMKSFGFDEAQDGTRCSRKRSLTTASYNTG